MSAVPFVSYMYENRTQNICSYAFFAPVLFFSPFTCNFCCAPRMILIFLRCCYNIRSMLQAAGGGSGGGVSLAGGGGGGDVARSLAGQVKALRSRVEELLERARDAEVYLLAKKKKKQTNKSAVEIEDSVEGHIYKLCMLLRSRARMIYMYRCSVRWSLCLSASLLAGWVGWMGRWVGRLGG